jgi:plasmid stabilization system protein ParE
LRVELRPEAFEELVDAVEWYERDYPGRGVRLRLAVDRALARIAEQPISFAERLGARAAPVARFPFVVFYEVVDERTVKVLAVAHEKRRPGYWRKTR